MEKRSDQHKSTDNECNADAGCSTDGVGEKAQDLTIRGCQPNFYNRKASGNVDFRAVVAVRKKESSSNESEKDEILIRNDESPDPRGETATDTILASRLAAACSQGYLLTTSPFMDGVVNKATTSGFRGHRRDNP